jgi:hypothetical protein
VSDTLSLFDRVRKVKFWLLHVIKDGARDNRSSGSITVLAGNAVFRPQWTSSARN